MKPPFIRSPYNYDVEKASNDTAYKETMPSLTIQSQAIDTDINEIMRRVGLGGPMPQNLKTPTYGDYTEITDFRSALEAIEGAEQNFMALDVKVRTKFENDPQKFLDFCTRPENLDQMREWGLAVPAPIAAPAAPQPATEVPGNEKKT